MQQSQNSDCAVQTFELTRKYGDLTAVNHIGLSIRKGELFSILGQNGAGKTTTIKMLCCLLKPTEGTARIMGYDIKNEATKVKQLINVSPQETAIARNLTTRENLQLIARIYGLNKADTRIRTEELIDLMGLNEKARVLTRKLSGGMQRRLNIAMALISDPDILFLDEPTLGLDPQARRELWKHIELLKGQKTIILTTHYLEEADSLADRISIMKSGSIQATGTPNELKTQFSEMQMMVIRGKNLTEKSIRELILLYPDIKIRDNEIEITGKKLVFDDIVDNLRTNGVEIEWLTMKESTLDDVFLDLVGKEV